MTTRRDRVEVSRGLPEPGAETAGRSAPFLEHSHFNEGWDPSDKPLRERHREQFLARVEGEFPGDDRIDTERVARAVFKTLATRVSAGEIEDVKQVLPAELKDLWP